MTLDIYSKDDIKCDYCNTPIPRDLVEFHLATSNGIMCFCGESCLRDWSSKSD